MSIRERMLPLLEGFDAALVTGVEIEVVQDVDPVTGLICQTFGATGEYDGKPFFARYGKTKYGQPTWRYYKKGTKEKDSKPKKLRTLLRTILNAKLAERLKTRTVEGCAGPPRHPSSACAISRKRSEPT